MNRTNPASSFPFATVDTGFVSFDASSPPPPDGLPLISTGVVASSESVNSGSIGNDGRLNLSPGLMKGPFSVEAAGEVAIGTGFCMLHFLTFCTSSAVTLNRLKLRTMSIASSSPRSLPSLTPSRFFFDPMRPAPFPLIFFIFSFFVPLEPRKLMTLCSWSDNLFSSSFWPSFLLTTFLPTWEMAGAAFFFLPPFFRGCSSPLLFFFLTFFSETIFSFCFVAGIFAAGSFCDSRSLATLLSSSLSLADLPSIIFSTWVAARDRVAVSFTSVAAKRGEALEDFFFFATGS
mmetsp:Transcript_32640/g.68945  ORF Transcript_32640/g.68945 Transcript_32640/m.68945 type:complete len:289 (+) Transcript_32640:1364-2230(+)